MTAVKPPTKPHVTAQNCGNCAFARSRPGQRRDLECRWDGPPWTDKGVTPGDWCRRWAMPPRPPSAPLRPLTAAKADPKQPSPGLG